MSAKKTVGQLGKQYPGLKVGEVPRIDKRVITPLTESPIYKSAEGALKEIAAGKVKFDQPIYFDMQELHDSSEAIRKEYKDSGRKLYNLSKYFLLHLRNALRRYQVPNKLEFKFKTRGSGRFVYIVPKKEEVK